MRDLLVNKTYPKIIIALMAITNFSLSLFMLDGNPFWALIHLVISVFIPWIYVQVLLPFSLTTDMIVPAFFAFTSLAFIAASLWLLVGNIVAFRLENSVAR